MTITADHITAELRKLASPQKRKASMWFFKTGKGQYGYGDQFIGVTVPEQRRVARKFRDASLEVVFELLQSPIHEHRLTGLLILDELFQQANAARRERIVKKYLVAARKGYVNNWDLVDSSAPYILGQSILDTQAAFAGKGNKAAAKQVWESSLTTLARSENLWEQRISIVATQQLIRQKQYQPTFAIADMLLQHEHDLIHKATGWMLREVGKYCGAPVLEKYLKTRYKKMPRTMLRYSIEHFSAERRKQYLQGLV